MFSQIKVYNFQSHKETIIILDKGFNCFLGLTDSGKSALMKALIWLITNKPLGLDDYRSYWCKNGEVRVSVITSEGVEVTKLKSDIKNQYLLSTLDRPLEAFGHDVPEEVKKVLNMTDINIQYQKDPFFLLNQSPPEVAKYLNKIIHLDIIDKSFSNAEKAKRKVNAELTQAESDLKTKEKELEQYKNLDEIDNKLAYFEVLGEEIEEEKEKLTRFYNSFQEIQKIDNELLKMKNICCLDAKVNDIIGQFSDFKKDKDKYLKLKEIYIELISLDKNIEQVNRIVKLESRVNQLLEIHKETAKEREKIDKIVDLYNDLVMVERRIEIEKLELGELQREFENDFPDICPLCGRKAI